MGRRRPGQQQQGQEQRQGRNDGTRRSTLRRHRRTSFVRTCRTFAAGDGTLPLETRKERSLRTHRTRSGASRTALACSTVHGAATLTRVAMSRSRPSFAMPLRPHRSLQTAMVSTATRSTVPTGCRPRCGTAPARRQSPLPDAETDWRGFMPLAAGNVQPSGTRTGHQARFGPWCDGSALCRHLPAPLIETPTRSALPRWRDADARC